MSVISEMLGGIVKALEEKAEQVMIGPYHFPENDGLTAEESKNMFTEMFKAKYPTTVVKYISSKNPFVGSMSIQFSDADYLKIVEKRNHNLQLKLAALGHKEDD